MTGNAEESTHPSYTKIIEQLAPLDAVIIRNLYHLIKQQDGDYRAMGFKIDHHKDFKVSEKTFLLSFENIWRLGICNHGDGLGHLNRVKQIVFTDYGWSFMQACEFTDS